MPKDFEAIFTADLHLTDNPRDEYRWRLFDFLVNKCPAPDVFILGGDLTDAKDKHSAVLVNRMVNEIKELSYLSPVVILRGNHDYVDEALPFFQFLEHVGNNITFVTEPTHRQINCAACTFLPNTRDYKTAWKKETFDESDFIFCHQTFDGCLSENGTKLEGIPHSVFKNVKGRVYSGDIHKPQRVGSNIEYVGAPYRIRFGDKFDPRILRIGKDEKRGLWQEVIWVDTVMKYLIKIDSADPIEYLDSRLRKGNIIKGDQLKVRVVLSRDEYPSWPDIKNKIQVLCKKAKVELHGLELLPFAESERALPDSGQGPARGQGPGERVDAYADQKGLSQAMRKAGKRLIQG